MARIVEADMRNVLCAGFRQEVVMPHGGRADCVSATHAIEIDWTDKWAEAIGQALYYAQATNLKPGIILVCRTAEDRCLNYALHAEEALAHWHIGATIWRCVIADTRLSDCLVRETGS